MDVDIEVLAIPFLLIRRTLARLDKGSTLKVMFSTLALTGCRISELDNMTTDLCRYPLLIWGLGKGQHGYRKEEMPEWWWKELALYRKTHRVPAQKLFGPTHRTFRRQWDWAREDQLPEEWRAKSTRVLQGTLQQAYKFQLKGLRKTYQTHLFNSYYKKWKDPSIALELTSKKMRHKSTRITMYHYVQCSDQIKIKEYEDKKIETIINSDDQMKLAEFA